MTPPQHPDDSPGPPEEIYEDAFAGALYDLLQLLDRRDDTAHTEIIRQRLERLAADGYPQPVIDLYYILAQRVSTLVLDKYVHGLLKDIEDHDKAHLARMRAQLVRGRGRRKLSKGEFLAKNDAALRELGARPDHIPSQQERAQKMGLDPKTLRSYEREHLPEP
jgi:hypothetical protein